MSAPKSKAKKKTGVCLLFVNIPGSARGHYYNVKRKFASTPLVLKKYNKITRKRETYTQKKA